MIQTKYINNKIIELSSNVGYVHKLGTDLYAKKIILLESDSISNYEEVSLIPSYTKLEYNDKVHELIRRRYSESEEFAIQRKAINIMKSPMVFAEELVEQYQDEYDEYNSYVELCKITAKEILNNGQEN